MTGVRRRAKDEGGRARFMTGVQRRGCCLGEESTSPRVAAI